MNINEALNYLHASHRGDYLIMVCPKCQKKEAFCYISDIKKWEKDKKYKIPIRCNRLNKCGKISYLNDFFDNEKIEEIVIKESNPIQMSAKGIHMLQTLMEYMFGQNQELNFDIRGISAETLKKYSIIYFPKKFESIIDNDTLKDEYGDKYRFPNYKDRDIMIPIYNQHNQIERLLLRSLSHVPKENDKYKKEIQVMLVKRGCEIWNIPSLYQEDKEIIFVTEGVYDALSILEVCKDEKATAIALPGIGKYKQLLKLLKKSPNLLQKTFVFAFDNDVAGKRYMKRALEDFKKNSIKTRSISLESYKDCNEYLQNNKEGFQNIVLKEIKNIKGISNS